MAAKKKEIRKVAPPAASGGAQRIIARLRSREGQEDADDLPGSPAEAAKELVRRLRDEARASVILVVAEQRDGQAESRHAGSRSPPRSTAGGPVDRSRCSGRASTPRRAGAARPPPRRSDRRRRRRAGAVHRRRLSSLALAAAHRRRDARRCVFLPHTYQTRDFAPALAARARAAARHRRASAIKDGGRPIVRAADVPGQAAAPTSPSTGPHRTRHVPDRRVPRRRDRRRARRRADAQGRDVAIDASTIRQKPEAPFKEAKQAVDLSQAERIVAVGRGIKGQETSADRRRSSPQAMGAELAASRPICDAGWLPMDRQIGSSGQTVAPKLYVALGISGAIQHLVGMKGSRTDRRDQQGRQTRPIFEVADYGIVGDLFEVVPAMIAELQGDRLRWPTARDRCDRASETLSRVRSSAAARPGCRRRSVWRSCRRRRAASRSRSPSSRRRARPARTCCRAPCSIRRRCSDLVPDFAGERRAARRREVHHDDVYFLTRARQAPVSDHAAAAHEPRQLHHLAQPVREVARPAWSRPKASTSSPGFAGVGDAATTATRVVGVRTGDRGHRQARRAEVRRSSRASTSARRSRSSPTACAAT